MISGPASTSSQVLVPKALLETCEVNKGRTRKFFPPPPRAGKTAVICLLTKPGNLNVIPKTHRVEGESQLPHAGPLPAQLYSGR